MTRKEKLTKEQWQTFLNIYCNKLRYSAVTALITLEKFGIKARRTGEEMIVEVPSPEDPRASSSKGIPTIAVVNGRKLCIGILDHILNAAPAPEWTPRMHQPLGRKRGVHRTPEQLREARAAMNRGMPAEQMNLPLDEQKQATSEPLPPTGEAQKAEVPRAEEHPYTHTPDDVMNASAEELMREAETVRRKVVEDRNASLGDASLIIGERIAAWALKTMTISIQDKINTLTNCILDSTTSATARMDKLDEVLRGLVAAQQEQVRNISRQKSMGEKNTPWSNTDFEEFKFPSDYLPPGFVSGKWPTTGEMIAVLKTDGSWDVERFNKFLIEHEFQRKCTSPKGDYELTKKGSHAGGWYDWRDGKNSGAKIRVVVWHPVIFANVIVPMMNEENRKQANIR